MQVYFKILGEIVSLRAKISGKKGYYERSMIGEYLKQARQSLLLFLALVAEIASLVPRIARSICSCV